MTPRPARTSRLLASPVSAVVAGLLLATGITTALTAPAEATESRAAAGPACGDTLTRDTQLTANLDCRNATMGLRLRPGVLLDLAGYTLTVKGTRRAIVISALGGQGSTTEVRNGTLVGGRGISMTGTDDAVDAGRLQRLRLSGLEMQDADLDVVDATARVYGTTMIRPALRMRHGLLDVVRSTLVDVDAGAIADDPQAGNRWNLTNSSVSGAWWSSGDTRVNHSTVIDTAEEGSRTPVYRDLVIANSNLQGPVYPVTALAGEHSITDSKVDRSGGFVVDDLLSVSNSKLRRIGPLDSGATGTTVVTGSDFNSANGATLVQGHLVQVSDSTFRNTAGVAISGDTVEVSGSQLRGGKGLETVRALSLTASGNTLINNSGTGLHAQGAATVTGNVISGQRGDGIFYDTNPDGSAPTGTFQVQDNKIFDGFGWGILTTSSTDPALVSDLGGNVAARNALGQCSSPIVCAAQ